MEPVTECELEAECASVFSPMDGPGSVDATVEEEEEVDTMQEAAGDGAGAAASAAGPLQGREDEGGAAGAPSAAPASAGAGAGVQNCWLMRAGRGVQTEGFRKRSQWLIRTQDPHCLGPSAQSRPQCAAHCRWAGPATRWNSSRSPCRASIASGVAVGSLRERAGLRGHHNLHPSPPLTPAKARIRHPQTGGRSNGLRSGRQERIQRRG